MQSPVSASWDTRGRELGRHEASPKADHSTLHTLPLTFLWARWPYSSLALIWYLPFHKRLLFQTEEVLGARHFSEIWKHRYHSCLLAQTASVVLSGSLLFGEVGGRWKDRL